MYIHIICTKKQNIPGVLKMSVIRGFIIYKYTTTISNDAKYIVKFHHTNSRSRAEYGEKKKNDKKNKKKKTKKKNKKKKKIRKRRKRRRSK